MDRVTLGLIASLLALACGPAAAPAPSGGAAPAAASAPLSDAAYRQQVIDAARAEGEVNAALHTSWTPDGIQRLEDALEREYGVRIRINFTPIVNYGQRSAELLTEVGAGATPSFDVYQISDVTAAVLRRVGAVETVNWAPLLPAGTPAGSMAGEGAYVVVYTDHFGLMSDPTTISDADVPRSLKDLGNARWRGKVMLFVSANVYLPWVIRLGKEETYAALSALVQNGAVADTYPNQLTRFAAREYSLATTGVTFQQIAQARGIPSRFTPIDFSANTDHYAFVARGAAHPNAAKLLAAVLAGPEGQRLEVEYIGVGNRYYPDNRESKLEQEALAAGFPSFAWADNPDAITFVLSPEGEEVQREMERILKGG